MKMKMVSRRALLLAALVGFTGLSAVACKARDAKWDVHVESTTPVGLSGSVALLDSPLDRMVFLTAKLEGDAPGVVETVSFPVGQNVTTVKASADLSKLFVLSRGVFPRTEPDDELPQLIVFDGGTSPKQEESFVLDDPMEQLAIDPLGEWVVAFDGDATVTNANELVFLELGKGEPVSKTIRSFGGRPLELVFTDELTVPQGSARRFLLVRTDRDVTLIDLSDLSKKEVTVKLPEDASGNAHQPVQMVFDEGDPEELDDSRIAIRLASSSDVVLLQLGAASAAADEDQASKDFSVVVNIVDVGGVPSTIDFVRTDGGLRLAALTGMRATLINPESTLTETVDMPHRFDQMTRITSLVDDAPDGGDVALLWGSSQQIAFWSLGSTSSTPYRSVDSTELDMVVSEVLDVPPPNQHLKVLVNSAGLGFFVLDLRKRESFPLETEGSGYEVQVSPDGERLWVSRAGGNEFSAVQLGNLHPAALHVQPGVNAIFDIERTGGGRAAMALHLGSGWATTILDADEPDSAVTAYFPALELEGLL